MRVLLAAGMTKLTKLEQLQDRVAELEQIVLEKRKRPPSRLGTTFRYLAKNLETLQAIYQRKQIERQMKLSQREQR